MSSDEIFDVAIIGGGINGCGIVRDAQGRGLKSILIEKDDLAGATSSASTKLIHGGLRYLEHNEFRLVREALNERELLMRQAPHIIWPLKFVLPHSPELRPAWMIRIGLFLYDFLGKRTVLPRSKGMNLTKEPEGAPLKGQFKKGFSYADLWAQDTRLSILSAMDAKRKGAEILTRTEATSARRTEDGKLWQVETKNAKGQTRSIRAKALFNAAGPWAGDVDTRVVGANAPGKVRKVKGSHIVVKKLFDGDQAYILQNDDERIIFAIPYEQHFTLIGTTDVNHEGDPKDASCSDEEKSYLCRAINLYFDKQISEVDIVWTYAGVRPLLDAEGDAKKLSRDYSLRVEGGKTNAPLISVYGGKITAFRELADDAMHQLAKFVDTGKTWTNDAVLPGGDLGANTFEDALDTFRLDYAFLSENLSWRYLRNYGSLARDFLQGKTSLDQLGSHLGDNVYEAELQHLVDHEFAQIGEDVYWRRSRLGLHLSDETKTNIDQWMIKNANV